MASVLELGVNTGKWDAGLNKAKKALDNFVQSQGGLNKALDAESQKMGKFVSMMGKMESSAKSSKGQMADYKSAIEQLTMQFNRMTEAQKKAVGQEYQQAIDQLTQKFHKARQEAENLNRELNAGGSASSQGGLLGGDKFSGMLQVLGGNLMTKGVMIASNFAAEMGNMVKQGIELAKQGEGIRIAFERLGRGDILNGLREATHGTVTDLELMKAAVKFNDFKLPVEELGTMLAFAQQKAKDTGQSVDYMVESIVTGLGRKSLMILDNLGLSAAEIKEKMKQTGDMTKAVGEIIREQMSKAGDYIETAADQATAANVRLENAMTDLGNALKPLTSDFNTFWTDIKVAGLNFLKDVMTPMLNQLTEAGRIANQLKNMSGNSQVTGQINILNSKGSRGEQLRWFNQVRNSYLDQIRDLNTMIDNGGKMPGAGSGESRDIRWLQSQVGALKQMRDEFVQQATAILWPSGGNTPTTPTTPTTTPTTKSTAAEKYIPLAGSIDEQIAKVKELQDAFNKTADQSVRGKLLVAIDEATRHLEYMKGGGAGPLSASTESLSQHLGLNTDLSGLKMTDEDLDKLQALANAGKSADESWSSAMGAISGLSSALASIEDPAVKVLGIVAEAIATIALTFAKSLKGTFTPWDWIAGAAAGTATMISTIAAIKSATSGNFAEGGIVPGNSNSGDNLRVYGLNSGELILNKSQQNNIAALLRQQSSENKTYQPSYVSGEQIWVAMNRYLKRSGQGEVLTWKS